MLLAKSERAAKRLLESSTKYLEKTLKLKVNQKKSRVVSVFAIRNFKFLGFTLGKNGKGIYVRVHGKSWKKMKTKLKELSSRRSCQSIRPSLEKIKVFMRGMAELLWDCGYEEQDRRTKLMAVSPYSNVHMETMEVTQNKEKKSYKTRNT